MMNEFDRPTNEVDPSAVITELRQQLQEGKGEVLAPIELTPDSIQLLPPDAMAIMAVSENKSQVQTLLVNGVPAFAKKQGIEYLETEMRCLEICAQVGINTFKPLFLTRGGKDSYLVTELMQVLPVENITINSREAYAAVIRAVATKLTELHKHGILHGDARPKNYGYDPAGELIVYDFDSSTISAQPIDKQAHREELQDMFYGLETQLRQHVGSMKLADADKFWFQTGRDTSHANSQVLKEFTDNY
jgi:serine/threonine protein kinase